MNQKQNISINITNKANQSSELLTVRGNCYNILPYL